MKTNVAARRTAAATAACLGLFACAHPTVVERALAARGTHGGAFTREVEARVHYGFPGIWSWEVAFAPPESFRLTVQTTGSAQHYVFDGAELRSWIGSALVSRDREDVAGYRSLARWLAVTSLEVFRRRERIAWQPANAEALPDGAYEGVWVRFRDDDARYQLAFDSEHRLVAARGPIEIPGVGAGRLAARFSDHRAVAGAVVPFAATYRLNDEPFFDEHLVRFLPGPVRLDPSDAPHEGAGSRF